MEIIIKKTDITSLKVDAIVNAANSSLLGGAGVDGAIHTAAGPKLLKACQELRRTLLPAGLPVGQAVTTPGFNLPAKWVIHTVGPNLHAGQNDPHLLESAFQSCLEQAANLGAQTLAFPAISAGAYGWDMTQVARISLNTIKRFCVSQNNLHQIVLREVTLALHTTEAEKIFHNAYQQLD